MIDLHTHTAVSDGTDTPAELVRHAAEAGLSAVAITDHDTFDGLSEAMAALPVGLQLVPGLEISCVSVEDGRRISLHLLAYLCDPTSLDLVRALNEVRASRLTRARRMAEALEADGWPVSWEQVETLAGPGATVGRPHLAQALVDSSLIPDVNAAFTPEWLGPSGRYWRGKDEIPVLDGIRLVRAAGGVPVFAHPQARRRGPVVSPETYEAMAGAGLFGVEAHHPDHTPEQVAEVEAVAARLGLAVTGSSDYHGERKSNRLGQCTTSPEVFEPLVAEGHGAAVVTG